MIVWVIWISQAALNEVLNVQTEKNAIGRIVLSELHGLEPWIRTSILDIGNFERTRILI